MDWIRDSKWEQEWWGNCSNTFNEEMKQYTYARYMGLDEFVTNWHGRRGWDFGDKQVVDIGGGPVSLLLKCRAKRRVVVDPCIYPNWIAHRYRECGIEYFMDKAEDFTGHKFDLALIYNCLQHVISPAQIISNVKQYCSELRLFEWIDEGITTGHPHNLTEELLNGLIGQEGCVKQINEGPCVGKAYFGIFPL